MAITMKKPSVRMLRPTSPRTSSSRPAAACSLSCVKYGVPIDSTMIEYGSMKMQPRVLHDRTPARRPGGRRQDPRLHEPGELAGDDHEERPAREPADVVEPDAAPAEVGAHVQPGSAPEQQQDDGLDDDAERGGAGEQRDHLRGPVVDATTARSRRAAMKTRNPAIETKLLTIGAHVNGPKTRRALSDLADERIEAVEEDLRQAPVGERRRERVLVGREARRVELHQPRRERSSRHSRGAEQDDRAEGEELRDERAAAVGVTGRLDDLRNDHGRQEAGGDDRVDVVGQLVRDRERVACLGWWPRSPRRARWCAAVR